MRWWGSLGSFFGSLLPGGTANWTSPSWQASLAGSPSRFGRGSTSGELVNPATAGALPSVYRACSFIADSLASVELRIVQEQPDGGKVLVEDIDAARALSEWSFEGKELFLYHAALGGNGLAVLRRNARGGVQEIDSVVPRLAMAAVDDADSLFYLVASYIGAELVKEPEVVAQADMLHLRFRNVGDPVGRTVFGVAPIVTAAEQLGLVLASRTFQSVLWRYGAIPSGVITTPRTLKQAVIDRLRAQWTEAYPKDGSVTGTVAVLEDGMTFAPMKPGLSPADANLVEYNRFGIEEVSRLYGVPPSVLAQTHNASYSTSVEEFRAAVLYCLRPWSTRFCDVLTRALLTREQRLKGIKIEAPLDGWLVAPGKEMSEYLKELVNAGILNTNECRNALGYPDIAGGEVHRVPANMSALSNLPKLGLQQPKQGTP